MVGVLGCGDHIVEVRRIARFARDGSGLVPVRVRDPIRLSGVVGGSYTRTFDAWGPATITVEGGSACANMLSRIEPLAWEVRIIRGTETAYSGPILRVRQTSGEPGVTIECGDILSWFAEDGAGMINLVDMDYADTDPVDIAYDVITQAMAATDPPDNLLITDYLYRNPVGEGIDYAPGVTADYIMDTLDELTDYGLMYAAVGRRIILSSPATIDRAVVARLSTADLTDGVEVTVDGTDMAVMGVAVRDGDPPAAFVAGSAGTRWGTPMVRVDVDEGVSDRSALTAARRAIQGRSRPRVHVAMPSNVSLRASAPIRFRDLRPGSAHVTLDIRDIPRPVRQSLMITDVTVDFTQSSEDVRVTFDPLGEPTQI